MTRGLTGEAWRYLVGGSANTALSLGLYYVLQLVIPYQVAYAIAFVFGMFCSYQINIRFVFRTQHSAAKAAAFPLVHLTQYVVGAALLHALVEWIGAPQGIAPLGVAVVTVPMMFLLTRKAVR